MHVGKSEQRDHTVAGPFEDVALDLVDRLFPEQSHTLKEFAEVLRIQSTRQRGRPDEVDHQDGDIAALPAVEQCAHGRHRGDLAGTVTIHSVRIIASSRVTVLPEGTHPSEATPVEMSWRPVSDRRPAVASAPRLTSSTTRARIPADRQDTIDVPGSLDAFSELRRRATPLRLATNTTSLTRSGVADRLVTAGFAVTSEDILTAPLATAVHLRTQHPGARVFLLSTGDLEDDLTGIDIVGEEDDADVVVLGGAGLAYTHEQLNRAFNLLLGGASFVAMHRNLTWRTTRGMELDTGAYVMALEAATGTEATVIGKPSPDFFLAALDALGDEVGVELQPDEVMMIGDDVVNDVGGAQAMGMVGCLVRTGKFTEAALAAAAVDPDHVVGDLAAAVARLESNGH